MHEKKILASFTIAVAFLFLGFMGCSSSFSFSWNTEKKVKNGSLTSGKKAVSRESEAQSPTVESLKENKPPENSISEIHKWPDWLYGVQITRLPQKSPEALARFMDTLKDAGVKVVYLRVFQKLGDHFFDVIPPRAKEGVYFKTKFAPMVSNFLPLVCRLAHHRGIKVYAWMTTLSSTFLRCGKRCHHIYKYIPETRAVVRASRLSPFDPVVSRCLLGIFGDLARNPIDGVLIQDDLILHYNEDFSPIAVRRFSRREGRKRLSPRDLCKFERNKKGRLALKGYTPLFWEWSDWKDRHLADLLKKLIMVVKETRPAVKVAVDINYEALSAPRSGLAWFSRSVQTMETVARPDIYAVMSYQKQMQRELRLSMAEALERIRGMVRSAMAFIPDPNRWVFKIQTIDWRTRKPVEWRQIMETARAVSSVAPVRACLMPFIPPLLEQYALARSKLSKN